MLNYRGILNKSLLVALLSVALQLSHPRGASAVAAPAPGAQTAPAVAPEDAGAAQNWKFRLEFRELNLQLIGVATLQDQASCFLKTPGTTEQMIYTVGDVIGGYRIKTITPQTVTFERQGVEFILAIGQSSGAEPAAAAANAALPTPADDVDLKVADTHMKIKTRKFATAKLIEDADSLHGKDADFEELSGKHGTAARHEKFTNTFGVPISGELTSGYGYRRHPMGGGVRFHRGVDLAGPYGTPVKAAAAGRVIAVYNSTAHDLGRHIVIKHNDTYETLYGHLSRCLVSVGQWVDKGEIIGREGSTGLSTGPHLHFEIHRNKTAVNPLAYIHVR